MLQTNYLWMNCNTKNPYKVFKETHIKMHKKKTEKTRTHDNKRKSASVNNKETSRVTPPTPFLFLTAPEMALTPIYPHGDKNHMQTRCWAILHQPCFATAQSHFSASAPRQQAQKHLPHCNSIRSCKQVTKAQRGRLATEHESASWWRGRKWAVCYTARSDWRCCNQLFTVVTLVMLTFIELCETVSP